MNLLSIKTIVLTLFIISVQSFLSCSDTNEEILNEKKGKDLIIKIKDSGIFYYVYSAKGLTQVAEFIENPDSISQSVINIVLESDIDMSTLPLNEYGGNWTPMNGAQIGYTINFYGDGDRDPDNNIIETYHNPVVIKGLKLRGKYNSLGLFSDINGAFSNITFQDIDIEVDDFEGIYPQSVGAIAGNKSFGLISHCRVSGNILIKTKARSYPWNDGLCVGGIVGINGNASNSYCTITTCLSDVNIIIENARLDGKINVGGVTGWNNDRLRNCKFTGKIEQLGTEISDFTDSSFGGIAGLNTSTISLCNSSGTIKGLSNNTGGIAGYCGEKFSYSGNVVFSYFNGKISIMNDFYYGCAGGIVGKTLNNYNIIFSCYSTGNIQGNIINDIVGTGKSRIKFCSATTNYSGNYGQSLSEIYSIIASEEAEVYLNNTFTENFVQSIPQFKDIWSYTENQEKIKLRGIDEYYFFENYN